MPFSKKSKILMSFFAKNKEINQQSLKTKRIFTELYEHILYAHYYVLFLNQSNEYRSVTIKRIRKNIITKPKHFNANSFSPLVMEHINNHSVSEIAYTFSLFDRKIKILFIVEECASDINIAMYNGYVDNIIMWLYIVHQYASNPCSNSLVVYFYFTHLEKHLPTSHLSILDEIHVNTAFTANCSEIVVYRKEEWFKVFVHETFHHFGLDFSEMNNNAVNNCILNLFHVHSEVNLYESYAECWAEIINVLFCSFKTLRNKNNVEEFLSASQFFIDLERTYSFFQMAKVLNFMGLTYSDLYLSSTLEKSTMLYKEKTNVLSYYIIKTILLNNYPSFLSWCHHHNSSLLQFKKTKSTQLAYCALIANNYKTKSMMNGMDENNKLIYQNRIPNYILSNLRMTICEMD